MGELLSDAGGQPTAYWLRQVAFDCTPTDATVQRIEALAFATIRAYSFDCWCHTFPSRLFWQTMDRDIGAHEFFGIIDFGADICKPDDSQGITLNGPRHDASIATRYSA